MFSLSGYVRNDRSIHSLICNFRIHCIRRCSSSTHSSKETDSPNHTENNPFDKNRENVLKVVQRFIKDPKRWPEDEQPFAVVEKEFVGKIMHPMELCPERGFVRIVPMGSMLFRHFFRSIRAKGNFSNFKENNIFDEKTIYAGTVKVFELISQCAYKDNLSELIARKVCVTDAVSRFEAASHKMSSRQRSLLNLSVDDVYSVAPGVLGPFQFIRPLLRNRVPYLTYTVLCCALYKKEVLFNAVKELPLEDHSLSAKPIPIPTDYGFAAPRLIFGHITFGHQIISKRKVDPEVNLVDFQYIVL